MAISSRSTTEKKRDPTLENKTEWSIARALKRPIFVIQKAAAPKKWAEFRQRPIGYIRRSLAMLCDVWRRRATVIKIKRTN